MENKSLSQPSKSRAIICDVAGNLKIITPFLRQLLPGSRGDTFDINSKRTGLYVISDEEKTDAVRPASKHYSIGFRSSTYASKIQNHRRPGVGHAEEIRQVVVPDQRPSCRRRRTSTKTVQEGLDVVRGSFRTRFRYGIDFTPIKDGNASSSRTERLFSFKMASRKAPALRSIR